MKRKIIALALIALLAVSFVSARTVNFYLGPSFSFYNGQVPVSEDPAKKEAYTGTAFGIDAMVSFTASRSEIYFQNTFSISDKQLPNEEFNSTVVPSGYEFDSTLEYRARLGYMYGILSDPVRLSAGGGLAFQLISSAYKESASDERFLPIALNIGLGLSAKVDFEISRFCSLYARIDADFYPASIFINGAKSGEDPKVAGSGASNLDVAAAAGVAFFF